MVEPGLILTGVVTVGGILIWALRQEGRINAHDKEHEEHRKEIEKVRVSSEQRHSELREDISYIRERIDTALKNGH